MVWSAGPGSTATDQMSKKICATWFVYVKSTFYFFELLANWVFCNTYTEMGKAPAIITQQLKSWEKRKGSNYFG